VELIHHHFITKGTQVMTRETLLPFKVEKLVPEKGEYLEDYIIEPDSKLILKDLTPLLINLQFLIAHIDSLVSEHVARMTAMQIATDNADELVDEVNRPLPRSCWTSWEAHSADKLILIISSLPLSFHRIESSPTYQSCSASAVNDSHYSSEALLI
jgi:hypothetical protein